jgi:anti-sigma B factor antagonist
LNQLEITWQEYGRVVHTTLVGALDTDTAEQFDQKIMQLLEHGHIWFVVDLGGLEYISSAGIGVLVGCANELRESDGDLRLVAVPAKIARVLDMLALLDFFEQFPDIASAVDSFDAET